MTNVIWKPVKGYEGLYEVSSNGEVKSLKRTVDFRGFKKIVNERILKLGDSGDGYPTVYLSKNGKRNTYKVHRLVAIAFHENSDFSLQVNHIDGNKRNNHYKNLEWTTKQENIIHAHKNKLIKTHGEYNNCSKLKYRDVELIRSLYKSGKYTQKELAKKFSVTSQNIWLIVHNKKWKEVN
ncbi:NUMOD4 motif-containing HNH endonuclease [Paraliobacillus ryukyuensis]|uniref:NUMOD4 motif-containing HNH endonuclease n=1 Tax=Paraliobacillus ryukyuensis TaxID=200904 RepID=UPI0009A90CCD|nr:NUMOD4 motif-containing HNH endonuclease [Paraliobacillus ryukyuensis]